MHSISRSRHLAALCVTVTAETVRAILVYPKTVAEIVEQASSMGFAVHSETLCAILCTLAFLAVGYSHIGFEYRRISILVINVFYQ